MVFRTPEQWKDKEIERDKRSAKVQEKMRRQLTPVIDHLNQNIDRYIGRAYNRPASKDEPIPELAFTFNIDSKGNISHEESVYNRQVKIIISKNRDIAIRLRFPDQRTTYKTRLDYSPSGYILNQKRGTVVTTSAKQQELIFAILNKAINKEELFNFKKVEQPEENQRLQAAKRKIAKQLISLQRQWEKHAGESKKKSTKPHIVTLQQEIAKNNRAISELTIIFNPAEQDLEIILPEQKGKAKKQPRVITITSQADVKNTINVTQTAGTPESVVIKQLNNVASSMDQSQRMFFTPAHE